MMLFFDFWEKGGFFVYPLLFCALVSIWVFVQRYFHFWRATIDTREFTSGIRNLVKANRISEAVSLCATTPGPVAAILHSALLCYGESRAQILEALDRTAQLEINRLDHNLSVLASLARITPLIGLLGTIAGVMNLFYVIQIESPFVQQASLAKGLWQALITTALGLLIAIPDHFAFDYLTSRVRHFTDDMSLASSEITELILEKENG